MNIMLLETHKPKALKDVIGNARQIMEIKNFLKNWKPDNALLIHGPPGCGKSLCVELIARELGYELVESHAIDARGYKGLGSIMKAGAQQSLFYKKKLILIDELELVDSVKGITEIIQESRWPVILIASNPYEQKLSYLRKSCTLVKFDKIRADYIANLLKSIAAKEGIKLSDGEISQISHACNGDVRSALIDLECNGAPRDKEENVFETLKILFKTMDINNSRYALASSEKTPEELFLWLEENIPQEYEEPEEIAAAYDCLSKADIVTARIIKRQSWALQKYYGSFLCGVSLAKKQSYKKFTAYMFPRIRAARGFEDIAGKISKKLHVSKKEALQYIPLIALIRNKNLDEKLGLTADELDTL